MRHAIAIILIVFSTGAAFGANETALLLEAPRVNKVLFVEPNGKELNVKIDQGSFTPLKDGTTFKASAPIDVAIKDFNPLKLSFATSEALRDDETAKAIADFLQKIIDTAGAVGVAPTEKAADAIPKNTQALIAMKEGIDQSATDNGCEDYVLMHGCLI